MVNPRKPGPAHGRIQKFVAGIYRRLEAVGSFPNRVLKAAGLITMREHYQDMKKLAREADEEIKKREVEVKRKAMEWKGSSKDVVDKALKDSYEELEKSYLGLEKKYGEAQRDIKSLKSALGTKEKEIKELEKRKGKASSKEKEELKESLQKKNEEAEKLTGEVEALKAEVKRLTPRKGIYPLREAGKTVLSNEEVEELTKEGYRRVMTKDLDDNLRHFMVKVQGQEELQHAALNWLIYEEISKHTRNLKTVPSSDSVDISFTSLKGGSVGVEVETGSMLKKLGEDGFKKKIDDKLKQHAEVFIVLTESEAVIVGKYRSLGLGVDVLTRGEVAARIKGFFETGQGTKPGEDILEFFTEPITIDEFAEKLDVSRPTAYQRLDEIKDKLESFTEGRKKFYQRKK